MGGACTQAGRVIDSQRHGSSVDVSLWYGWSVAAQKSYSLFLIEQAHIEHPLFARSVQGTEVLSVNKLDKFYSLGVEG